MDTSSPYELYDAILFHQIIKGCIQDPLCATLHQILLETDSMEELESEITLKGQEEVIRRNLTFASRIPDLHPELKEKYKELLESLNSGYI